MLTPQEAESHVFPKASFGGYNMLQVDTFLDSLIEDYRTLYQENASLKSKMKVLVEKVEEYRATEDAMRMTLHSAQKMADAMVKEGEAKKTGRHRPGGLRRGGAQPGRPRPAGAGGAGQIDIRIGGPPGAGHEQTRLEAARTATTAYIAQLKELYTKEIQYIGSLSNLTAPRGRTSPRSRPPRPSPPGTRPPPRRRRPWSPFPRNSRRRWPRISRPPWPRSSSPRPKPPPPAPTWGTPGASTRSSSARTMRSNNQ